MRWVWAAVLLGAFATTHASTTNTWTNTAGDGKWNTAGNWSRGSVPSTTDDVVFDSTSTANCAINVTTNKVVTFSVNTGYSGTITQNNGFTLNAISLTLNSSTATFTGGDSTSPITLTGSLTLSAGTFTSTAGTLAVFSSLVITTPAATFNHNNGVININGNTTLSLNTGSATLYDFQITGRSTITTTGTVTVSHNFFFSNINVGTGGTIAVAGNITTTNAVAPSGGLTTTVLINGTSPQVFGASGGSGYFFPVTINQGAGGSLTVQDTIIMLGSWTFTASPSVTCTGTVQFSSNSPTISSGSMAFNHLSSINASSIAISGTVIVNGNLNLTSFNALTGGQINVAGNVVTTSGAPSVASTTILLNGSGAQSISAAGGTGYISSVSIQQGTGGTVAISDTLIVIGSWTYDTTLGGGAVTCTGLVTFTNGGTTSAGTMKFNNVSITGGNRTITGTMTVQGNFTLTAANSMNGGTVNVGGNLSTARSSGSTPYSTNFVLNGSNNTQTLSQSATGLFPGATITVSHTGTGGVVAGSALNFAYSMTQSLAISSGTLDLAGNNLAVGATGTITLASGATLQLQGGETVSKTPTISAGGLVIYNGTAASYTLKNWSYSNLTINGGASSVFTFPANLTSISALTLTSGIASLAGFNLTATSLSNAATLRAQGNETISLGTMDTAQGTVEFVGRNIAETLTVPDFGAQDFYNLKINDTNAATATFQCAAAKSIKGTLVVSGGTFNANGQTVAVTGLTTISGGTYQSSTASNTFSGGLGISGGTFTGSSGSVTVTGTFALTSGACTAPSGTLFVSGNFTNGGGSFSHNGGTVTLNGSSQSVTGSTGFNAFTITAPDTVTFQSGATQTFAGAFTALGSAGNLITILSSTPGSAGMLSRSGSGVNCDYLSLKDSAATVGVWLAGAHSINVSGNSGWIFPTAFNAMFISAD